MSEIHGEVVRWTSTGRRLRQSPPARIQLVQRVAVLTEKTIPLVEEQIHQAAHRRSGVDQQRSHSAVEAQTQAAQAYSPSGLEHSVDPRRTIADPAGERRAYHGVKGQPNLTALSM